MNQNLTLCDWPHCPCFDGQPCPLSEEPKLIPYPMDKELDFHFHEETFGKVLGG